MKTVKTLIEELKKFPMNAVCYTISDLDGGEAIGCGIGVDSCIKGKEIGFIEFYCNDKIDNFSTDIYL